MFNRVFAHKKSDVSAGSAISNARMDRVVGSRVITIQNRASDAYKSAESYALLRHASRVIGKHGMSRPLMAFINRGDSLSKLIPTVPATESLDVVPVSTTNARHVAFMADVTAALESEQAVVADWISSSGTDVGDFMESTRFHLAGLKDEMAGVQRRVKDLPGQTADMPIFNASAASRQVQMGAVEGILSSIGPVDMSMIASDGEYRTKAHAELCRCCDAISPFAGVTRNDAQMVHTDDVATDHIEQGSTMSGLGYTPEMMGQLTDQAMMLIDRLQTMVDAKDDYVAAMVSASDATPLSLFGSDDIDDLSTEAMSDLENNYTLNDHRCMMNNYLHVLTASVGSAITNVVGVMNAGQMMVEAEKIPVVTPPIPDIVP